MEKRSQHLHEPKGIVDVPWHIWSQRDMIVQLAVNWMLHYYDEIQLPGAGRTMRCIISGRGIEKDGHYNMKFKRDCDGRPQVDLLEFIDEAEFYQ